MRGAVPTHEAISIMGTVSDARERIRRSSAQDALRKEWAAACALAHLGFRDADIPNVLLSNLQLEGRSSIAWWHWFVVQAFPR